MNIQTIVRLFLLVGISCFLGCGGGGGGSSTPAPTPTPVAKTTTSISGKVSFPSLTNLVAKQVATVVPDAAVQIQAFTLEGVAVGSPVIPTYDDAVPPGALTDFTLRTYSYTLTDIPIGKDYIVKAKRVENGKTQELKKLIEKTDVVLDPLLNQSLNSVSTAAVVVASQKLTTSMGIISGTITLGDPLPSLGTKTVTNLSDAIVTDVAPKSLETSIQNAQTTLTGALASGNLGTALAAMTPEEKKALVDLVNILNIVVASVANNADPAQILAGTSTAQLSTAGPQLKLLSVDTGGTIGQSATAVTTITQTIIQETVTSAVITYIPPRVKLEISTDSTSLYGIIVDITVPADANVRADATGKLDMALLSVPAGVTADAQYTAASRKIRIALASGSVSLSGNFITLNFDRTQGKTLSSADFPHSLINTSDSSGNSLSSTFTVVKTVTSSGS